MSEIDQAGKRETQLGQQMDRLAVAIEKTTNIVQTLRVRLRPVLQVQPTSPEEDSTKLCELVPFANEIRCKAEQVEQITDVLELTLSELEM